MGDFDCSRPKICKSLRLLTGFLMGHRNLKAHLHQLGIVDHVFRIFCEAEEENPIQVLMNCDVISVKRARSFGWHQNSLKDAPGLDPLKIQDSLKRLWLDDGDWFCSEREREAQ